MMDFYKIIGIEKNADYHELYNVFMEKAINNHPDKNNSELSRKKFKDLNIAFNVLRNKRVRKVYDSILTNTDTIPEESKDLINSYVKQGEKKAIKYSQMKWNRFANSVRPPLNILGHIIDAIGNSI